MHLLLGAVYAVRALELGLLAALPLLVVAQRGLELVDAAAIRAGEAGLAEGGRRRCTRAGPASGQRQRQARRPLLPRQAAQPHQRLLARRTCNTRTVTVAAEHAPHGYKHSYGYVLRYLHI